MPKRRSAGGMLLAGVLAVLATIVTFAISLTSLQARIASIQQVELRFETTAQELLATVGFAGLIHDFKNCVIRGGAEPAYCDATEARAAEALVLLAELEASATAGGVALEAAPILEMVEAYRSRVPQVRAGHAAGRPAEQIDAAVRWDDEPSARAFSAIIETTSRQINARVEGLYRDTFIQYTLAILVLLCIGGWLLFAIRTESRATRDRESQLTAVFSAVAGGLVAFDAEGRIALTNPAAADMLDLPDQPTPFDWPAHVEITWAEASAAGRTEPPLSTAHAGGRLHEELCHLRLSAPSSRPDRLLRVSAARLDLPGLGLRSVLTMEDVSEQEQQRRRIERVARLDALGQLTGGIAHDFNNHLATILYAVDLAAREVESERGQVLLQSALRTVERGRELTDRLLSFASRHPGTPRAERVEAVFTGLRPLAEAALPATITIEFSQAEPDLKLLCDLGQLENALLNIILNARDAILSSGMGSHLRVHARSITLPAGRIGDRQAGATPGAGESHRYVELSVTDDGPGMTAEVRARATEPFFTTKPLGEGTGLGLAMAYGFARQSRGDLTIYSEEGHGTAVRLILPRADATEDRREEPVPPPDILPAKGESILLAEDDEELRTTMVIMLEDMGYRVEAAANAAAALEIVERGTPIDLALCDVIMPGEMNGMDLAKRLLARDPERPVLLMSGYAGLISGEDAESDLPILRKPCMPAELSRALRAALGD
ncbi:response regulator [Vannielia sp. SX4]|uniref:response regulator n=1 Tax=Vannielia sp. SX4 TaxID=3463852 RepID=UPI004057E473